MVAVLKPIEARCIERPKFDNAHTSHGTWVHANSAKLRAYFTALGHSLPSDAEGHMKADGDAHRYQAFCLCQYDREFGRF